MISKLTCDQVADNWPIIKEGLQKDLALPIMGKHKYRESYILESLLAGSMEAWAMYNKDEENNMILLQVIVLASIYTDPCTKNRTFYVFSMLWYRDSSKEDLLNLKEALTKYAKSKDCHTMSSATNRKELVQMAGEMGIDNTFTLLHIDLEKE